MPSQEIYVQECIIHKIELYPKFEISNVDELSVNFKFASLLNFDIDTQYFLPPQVNKSSGNQIVNMYYGKTVLFISRPSELRRLLQSEPFQITLYNDNRSIGYISVPWKMEFAEMVKFFQSLGIVKSTTVEDVYELRNDNNVVTAKIDVFIRMSCFGQNIQTMFQIHKDGTKMEYIFRQRNASRTFKVDKHDDERCQPLVDPLFSGITDVRNTPGSEINMKENVSLTQLFDRDRINQKESYFQTTDGDEGIRLDFADDFDKVSICFRPAENKFFDLLNLLSADVKTTEQHTEVTFQKKNVNRISSFLKSVGGDLKSSPDVVIEEEDDMREMTADKIAKKLCGNKDCPAVKRFKEYGIGPLATGANLGTLYGDVEPPVTYGMSHTYGTMCEYGPYGVFSRPKHEDLPFVPRTENTELPTVKPCRIKKQESSRSKKRKNKRNPEWHSSTCPLCPDRLRGGSDNDMITEEHRNTDDNDAVMPKSPMIECKSVMDQFDSILAEYKKALGPCGHATCPYAQTIAEDTCKKMCDNPVTIQVGSTMSCDDSPCNVEGCPYADDPKKKQYPAGCGNPKCAYTKYKLGLLDDDAELELKFLPPALGDNCGDPHCKYPLAPPLPPIHWDCPDPLPKGPCRNLNCPFQPPPLKKFKTKQQLKTGPCGSPMCPYALPQPCALPTCPFAMRPCPMAQEPKQKRNECSPNNTEEDLCENPDCPFAKKNADKNLEDKPDDPRFKGEFQDCVNPSCPYRKKDKRKKKKPKRSPCGNPACPSIKLSKKDKAKKSSSEESSICSNVDCPFRRKKYRNRCQKSSSSDSVSLCSDPDCPYAGLKKEKKKREEPDDQKSSSSCQKSKNDDVCSNPDFPERKSRNVDNPDFCNVPNCPFSQQPTQSTLCSDPRCPYLQPLSSCGIPNCPYEPIPLRFSCENPKCPSKTVNFKNKTGRNKFGLRSQLLEKKEDVSDNTNTVEKTTTVCEENTTCKASEECENPDCEMNEEATSPGQSGDNNQIALHQPKKKGRRKKKGKFVYSIGDTYPGTKLGHKECVTPVFNVPANMGWLWNIFTPIMRLKPRRGWRPGALTKTIAARIRAHRQAKGLGFLRVPTFKQDGTKYDETDIKVLPKPTLQIQKKEGTYWITMNPLKDPNELVENEDPYMDCTPMTFKIIKNKKPQDDFCYCDGDEPLYNYSLDSSSDSELDIEFTPPAGIIHPERFKKRPNVVCCEAQYDPADFEVPKKKVDKDKDKDKGKGKKGKGGKEKKGGGKKKK